MAISYRVTVLALAAVLAGCDAPVILQGTRESPREAIGVADPAAEPAKAVAIALPAAHVNSEWSQRAGTPSHAPGNVAFDGAFSPVWTANIGKGDTRKNRITADPVVAAGRIFTLDSDDNVTATTTGGGRLWQADLTPASDKPGDASGGGLAFGDGLVFVTTGFGELVALDPDKGTVVWRQKFSAPAGGAPTVDGGKVYVVTRDGAAWAVGSRDGRIAWQVSGAPAQAGVAGVSAPAVSGDTVVFPFASGQLIAAKAADGTQLWNGFVVGDRMGRAYAISGDLTGDPVISGQTVFAGSASGRLAALDMKTGAPVWSAGDGAASPVVVAGSAIFFVNDEDQLLRFDARTGAEVWRTDMPYFTKDKDRKRNKIFVHYGPILAGGRLITASTDGLLRAFDPASGKLVGQAQLPDGAASSPVVAGGTLYVVSKSGQLHAFR